MYKKRRFFQLSILTATSACNKGRFVCEAKRGGQAWIPSYKVHDKFCDCVDGSDEAPGVCEVEVEMMTEELEVQQL